MYSSLGIVVFIGLLITLIPKNWTYMDIAVVDTQPQPQPQQVVENENQVEEVSN